MCDLVTQPRAPGAQERHKQRKCSRPEHPLSHKRRKCMPTSSYDRRLRRSGKKMPYLGLSRWMACDAPSTSPPALPPTRQHRRSVVVSSIRSRFAFSSVPQSENKGGVGRGLLAGEGANRCQISTASRGGRCSSPPRHRAQFGRDPSRGRSGRDNDGGYDESGAVWRHVRVARARACDITGALSD